MKQTIDLTNEGPGDYSSKVLDKAWETLDRGLVSRFETSNSAEVRSLTGSGTYYAVIYTDADNDVIGVTCTCPNGRNLNKAKCYHAAAWQLAFERKLWVPVIERREKDG
nr:MAG TPA: SWIM zinc finger protein [Caudoviricetes sp.]